MRYSHSYKIEGKKDKYMNKHLKTILVTAGLVVGLCGTAYANDHICKFNEYDIEHDYTQHLHLITKEPEIGEKLLDSFNMAPGLNSCETYTTGRRVGNLYMTHDGNVHFVNMDGTSIKNGIKNGYVFDDTGKLINTGGLVFAKYKDKWYDANERIEFDSYDDAVTFIRYMQSVHGLDQDDHYISSDGNGKYSFNKVSLKNIIEHTEAECNLFNAEVDRIYEESLRLSYGAPMITVIADSVRRAVLMSYTYDENYTRENMTKVITDKRGVCFHFAKIILNTLKKHGIDAEYEHLYTNHGADNHVVVQYRDESGNKKYIDSSLCYLMTDTYLDIYSQERIGTNRYLN